MTAAVESTKTLDRKRADALLRVAQTMVGTSLTATVPLPALKLTEMIGIAAADAWMFWDIYRIYYEEDLSSERLNDLLGTAGIVVMTGGTLSYAALRISNGLVNQFFQSFPVLGWVASGALTGSSTLTLGLTWLAFVEARYSAEHRPTATRHARTRATTGQRTQPQPAREEKDEEPSQASSDGRSAALNAQQEAEHTVTAPTVNHAANEEALDMPEDLGDGRVMTLHPEGKKGTRINAEKYVAVRRAILDVLTDADELTFKELTAAVEDRIPATFDGSVSWHVTRVKLDLEARGLIERVSDTSPQRLRISGK